MHHFATNDESLLLGLLSSFFSRLKAQQSFFLLFLQGQKLRHYCCARNGCERHFCVVYSRTRKREKLQKCFFPPQNESQRCNCNLLRNENLQNGVYILFFSLSIWNNIAKCVLERKKIVCSVRASFLRPSQNREKLHFTLLHISYLPRKLHKVKVKKK